MKKILFSLLAAFAAFAMTSCVKEQLVNADPALGGQPVQVTFSLNLGDALTKAAPESSVFDNASGEFRLYAAAFAKSNGALVSTSKIGGEGFQPVVTMNSKSGNVTLTLSKGQEYKVVFFAMHGSAYDVQFGAGNVARFAFKSGLKANDASLDAFFATVDVTATTASYDVTMKRPFAQLNVLVPQDNVPEGQSSFSSAMSVTAPASFDLFTGAAVETDLKTIAFADNAIAADAVGAYKGTHKWIGMNFVLVPKSGNVSIASFKESGMSDSVQIGTVPAKVNGRTNMVGRIYSLSDYVFNLEVNPEFGGEQEQDLGGGTTPGGDTPGGDTPGDDTPEDTEISVVDGKTYTTENPLVITAAQSVKLRVNGDDIATVEKGANGAKVTAKSADETIAKAAVANNDVVITPVANGKTTVTINTPAYTKASYAAQTLVLPVKVEGMSGEEPGGDEPAEGGSDTIVFADQNLENSTQYKDPFQFGSASVTFAGGANDGKYYTTGAGIRTYGDGTITVASSKTIVKIEYTFDPTEQKDGDAIKTFVPDDATFGGVDSGNYDLATQTWTGSAKSVKLTRATGTGHWRLQKIVVYYDGEGGGDDDKTVTATLTVTPASLALKVGATATLTATTNSSAKPTFVSDKTAVATVDASGKVTAVAEGTATITVSVAAVEGAFTAASKTVSVTVSKAEGGETPKEGDGTVNSPYTASQALAITKALEPKGESAAAVYVKGKISTITSVDTEQYGSAEYFISDDGSKTNEFQMFHGKYLGGAKFTSADQIKVGDEVIVYGKLKNFANNDGSTTPEMQYPEIYSLNGQVAEGGEGQGGGDVDTSDANVTLTNAEIQAATVDSEITSDNPSYRDGTITSDSGTWTGNFAKHANGVKYLQLRNKKGAYLKSPVFPSNVKKIVVTMTGDANVSLANRALYAIPADTVIPTGDEQYAAELWANKYGTVDTGTTKGAKVTLEFTGETKQFTLVVGGGATYIDEIAVYY